MKGSHAVRFLILATMLTWAGFAFAEDDPVEGRVTLKISATDPDNGILSFSWTQLEGRKVRIADPRAARYDKVANKWVSETYFIPTEPDKYVFEVTVKNEHGLETTKRFAQEVLPPARLPIADPGRDLKLRVKEKGVVSAQESKAFDGRSIVKYDWTVKGAPEGFDLQPDQRIARQFDFIPLKAGKYIFELKVNDGRNWSAPVSVEVIVTNPIPIKVEGEDQPPIELKNPGNPAGVSSTRPKAIAAIGGNKTQFRVGETVILDGSQSVVIESLLPKFIWRQIEDKTPNHPTVRTLFPDKSQRFSRTKDYDQNYPVQSFVATENGIYKFVLDIQIDETTTVTSDPVTFQVGSVSSIEGGNVPPPGPKPPVARVKANKTEVSVGDEVTLDGSESSGDGGAKLSYAWARVNGKPFPSNIRGTDGPVARFSAEQEGEYAVVLVVNDGAKQGTSDPVIIRVTASDKPPVIELDPTQRCNVREPIVIDAKIKDPQNYPLKIRWTCLDPKNLVIPEDCSIAARFRFETKTPGAYLFQVEATNSKGLSAVATTMIGVKDVAQLKPTAVITGPETAKVGDKVTLSGLRSLSPSQKPLSYRWADESEGGAKIKDPVPTLNKSEWTFKITEPGRHIVTLTVNDGVSDSEPIKFYVDVTSVVADPGPTTVVNTKPIARITGPKAAVAKTEVELSAESSTGSIEGPLQYFWNQQLDGGPKLGLTLEQRRAKVMRFTPLVPGQYVFSLTVMDANNQQSEQATFALDVKAGQSAPPVAVATLRTKDGAAPGKDVRLSAEASNDPGGEPLTYKWKQNSGPQTLVVAPRDTAGEIVVTPTKAGTYELQVIVNNGKMDSAPAPISFTVAAVPLPQAIIAEVVPPQVGDTVVLDGTRSKSPGGATGDQLQYVWRQTKGESLRLQAGEDHKSKIQFVVQNEGSYTWELTVSDGTETSEPQAITVTVKPRSKNLPPVAVVERAVISTEVGVPTVIDASASYDTDKGPEPLTFRWRRGNSPLGETKSILRFTPPAAATLTFEVQCYDGKDWSEPVTVTVNVLAPGAMPVAMAAVTDIKSNPVTPPVFKAASRTGVQDESKIIVLDGTKSTPKKDSLTYVWRQVSGQNLKLKADVLAKERVGFRIYTPGTYRFELIVSDGEISSQPATVDIKVIEDDEAPK